jgi:hypothetical protein
MNQLVAFRSADATPRSSSPPAPASRPRSAITPAVRLASPLPEERRIAQERGRHGEPHLDPHHAALRSPTRQGLDEVERISI